MSVGVIDYNMGNLGSVLKALSFLGAAPEVAAEAGELKKFDCCILPGVGNFGDGMEQLRSRGLDRALREFTAGGKRVFGICLGMQMLLESSEEAPGVAGLGVFPGAVRRFPAGVAKVPQIGWNAVKFSDDPIAADIPEGAHFYFVHSYYVPVDARYTAGTCRYITDFSAAVASGNWFATQFHPEKSQTPGLTLLKNFLALSGGFR